VDAEQIGLCGVTDNPSHTCPNCGVEGMRVVYDAGPVPVRSTAILHTQHEALEYPCADLVLAFCSTCGFVSNPIFDPTLAADAEAREDTQSCSPTFETFALALAQDLVMRHDLRHKRILEIGCGKGEFLTLLCRLGENTGVGYDPAFAPGRTDTSGVNVTFVTDYFDERYTQDAADFVCCKMTLEHIPAPRRLVGNVHKSLAGRAQAVVFFQVPDATRIWREAAFWDAYYEHCSYFCSSALSSLFRESGFQVLRLWRDYADQYLMIEARPTARSPDPRSGSHVETEHFEELQRDVAEFAGRAHERIRSWRDRLTAYLRQGRRVVLWGGSSKAVSWLNAIGPAAHIDYVVDINPYRQGSYIAGTGQLIIAPVVLRELRPSAVLLMNPIYEEEVRSQLAHLGLSAEIWHP